MNYIYHLTDKQVSASWLAMNISVLRTCFDKCCGTTLLETRIGPKRPRQLPSSHIPDISVEDVQLPFAHKNPIRYFYKWMKMKLCHGFRILRNSS